MKHSFELNYSGNNNVIESIAYTNTIQNDIIVSNTNDKYTI